MLNYLWGGMILLAILVAVFTGNMAAEKGLAKESGQVLPIRDDLRVQMKEREISEKSFSVFVQFEKDGVPLVYFV